MLFSEPFRAHSPFRMLSRTVCLTRERAKWRESDHCPTRFPSLWARTKASVLRMFWAEFRSVLERSLNNGPLFSNTLIPAY